MKFIQPQCRSFGDKKNIEPEILTDEITFNIFKFSQKPKPKITSDIIVICCFSEFGCEPIGPMYLIPQIIEENPDKYIIVVGWYGRDYFYKHLVDEFWEIKPEYMWLRNYARAFHNDSKNIKSLEKRLSSIGTIINSKDLGKRMGRGKCNNCKIIFSSLTNISQCPKCSSTDLVQPIFSDIENARKRALKIPQPSQDKKDKIDLLLKPNSVGIFARGRLCYGRNLPIDFYSKLIIFLKDNGYNPIWLGEKNSILECPDSSILDFSKMDESRDLEYTLALVSKCVFTIQFWTASTRLSSIVGTPWILFESPSQIWTLGHEGIRLNLVSFSKGKLVFCNYLECLENIDKSFDLIRESIQEVSNGNFEEKFGLINDINFVKKSQELNHKRIGGAFWKQ